MPNLANPNNPKPAPLQRMGAQRVLVPPGPVLPEKPPLQRMAAQRVLTPAAEGDGPCSYIYIPGLARSSFVNSPTYDLQGFLNRVRTTFGYLDKDVVGQNSRVKPEDDAFMMGAVKALCTTKGAKPLDCGQSMRWVQISSGKVKSKVFKFGSPQKNILSRKAGQNPVAPKELEYDRAHQSPCLAAEYMAQMKRALPVRQGEDKAEPAERKALAGLKSDDTLYIVGHGNPLGATLTFKCPPPASHPVRDKGKDEDQPGACNNSEHLEKWYVDPTTLAALLVAEGLPTTHKNIEMVMCYGAGLAVSNEQTVQSFCQRLAGALFGFGFNQIKVRGAVGLVMGGDLSVNPSITPRETRDGVKLIINTSPSQYVKPTDANYKKLFQTFASR